MVLVCPICKSRVKTRQDSLPPGRYYFYCSSCDNELSFDYSGADTAQVTAVPVLPEDQINYHYDKNLSGITRNYEDTTQIIIPEKIRPVREENKSSTRNKPVNSADIQNDPLPAAEQEIKSYPPVTKKKSKILRLFLIIILVLIIIFIYNEFKFEKESEPVEQIAMAVTAKAAADKVNAAVYSAEAYNSASTLDKDAQESIKKSEFDKAKAKLIEAIKKYDEAAKDAPKNMETMIAETKADINAFVADLEAYSKDKAVVAAVKEMNKDETKKYNDIKVSIDLIIKVAAEMCERDPAAAKAKIEECSAQLTELKAMSAPKEKKKEEEHEFKESPKEKSSEYTSNDYYSGSDDEEIKNTVIQYHNHILNGRGNDAFYMWASERRPKVNKDLIVGLSKETEYYKFKKMEVISKDYNSCEVLVRVIQKKAGKPEEYWETKFKMIKEYGEWKIWTTPGKKIW